MKIVATADVHSHLFDPPDCDLLILAGDLGPDGSLDHQQQWFDGPFTDWLRDVGKRMKVIAISGNHDNVLEERKEVARRLPCIYLDDQKVEVNGLKIYGCPYVPNVRMGFYTDNDEHWAKIPTGLDILVLHGPPRGYGDWMNGHVGSPGLIAHHLRARPKLTLFGHNHLTSGFWVRENMWLVNCTAGTMGAKKPNPPHEFNYDGNDYDFCSPEQKVIANKVAGRYLYHRLGRGTRALKLEANGLISEGAAGCERAWRCRVDNGVLRLYINGDRQHGDMMKLTYVEDGKWSGVWERHERTGVDLIPISE